MEEVIEKLVKLVDKLNEQMNNTDYIIYKIIKELGETHITVSEYREIIEMIEELKNERK